MAQELVTLQHPDGRRHRTDNASEINMLISTYGYQRVDEGTATQQSPSRPKRSGSSRRSSSEPEPYPSSSPTANSNNPESSGS